jgi:hypothetical protein
MNQKCIATTKNGAPCETKPQNGSDFCFFHDPTKEQNRKAASAAGGRAGTLRTLPLDTPSITVRTPAEACELIEAIINRVLRGEISHQIANAVAILVGHQLRRQARN